ncbi:MAG: hypothetical protein ACHQYP_11755 [Nitrospiria bacterium]
MKILRIYADTSIFGGCFDEEFTLLSIKFFEEVKAGRFFLVISDATRFELQGAPHKVKQVLFSLPDHCYEIIEESEEVIELRNAYLKAEVLTENSILDATHVAYASVAEVDIIISWNFKDIVHFQKIRGFHAVNLMRGYPLVDIYSPMEVIEP